MQPAATPNRDANIVRFQRMRDAARDALEAVLTDNATYVEFEGRRVTRVDINFLQQQEAYWDRKLRQERMLKAGYAPFPIRIRM